MDIIFFFFNKESPIYFVTVPKKIHYFWDGKSHLMYLSTWFRRYFPIPSERAHSLSLFHHY